ncbi:MAG: hypothetical protein EPN97_00165 [Alphaproteobacteria bacterium]|nr:MAG: hypothetical protein EPN97_00165 [Alphaproteobacteria bacterium]
MDAKLIFRDYSKAAAGRSGKVMSDSSSSLIVIILIVAGAVGAMFLVATMLVNMANSHPLTCWRISPMHNEAECMVLRTKFDN